MWFVAGEVCIREIHRNVTPTTPDAAIGLRNAQLFLDAFVHALTKLTGYFPVLSMPFPVFPCLHSLTVCATSLTHPPLEFPPFSRLRHLANCAWAAHLCVRV